MLLSPDEIANELGLVPKWKHVMGSQRKAPNGALLGGAYEINYCSFPLFSHKNEELHEMLDRITDELACHHNFFSHITENKGRVEFFIGWYSNKNSGSCFSYKLLEKLGRLKINLALDVYGEEFCK